MTRTTFVRRLSLFALLTLLGSAHADHQTDNLLDLHPGDLCPPIVIPEMTELENADAQSFANRMRADLIREGDRAGLPRLDAARCTVEQIVGISSGEIANGVGFYVLRFALEVRGPTVLTRGDRSFRVPSPVLWNDTRSGIYINDPFTNAAQDIRRLYGVFLSEWKASRPR